MSNSYKRGNPAVFYSTYLVSCSKEVILLCQSLRLRFHPLFRTNSKHDNKGLRKLYFQTQRNVCGTLLDFLINRVVGFSKKEQK